MTPDENEQSPGQIDPHADRAIRGFSSHLRNLRSFRAEINATTAATYQGVDIDWGSAFTVAVQRPNKLALVLWSGTMGTTIMCDGETLWRYWPVMQQYTEAKAPETLDGALTACGTSTRQEFGIPACVGMLLCDDPYRAVMTGVARTEYLGMEDIDGIACHRIKLFRHNDDWQLWIGPDEEPLLRRFVPDLSPTLARAVPLNPGMEGMTIETAVAFQNWQTNINLPEDQFRFTPPRGTVELDETALNEQLCPECEKCGRLADVHLTHVVAGQPAATTQRHLCQVCARAEGLLGNDMSDALD